MLLSGFYGVVRPYQFFLGPYLPIFFQNGLEKETISKTFTYLEKVWNKIAKSPLKIHKYRGPLLLGLLCVCQKDCLAQVPTRRQPHPLWLKATPTKHATKPRPSTTSNVGMPCGCGLIFNDIHRFFSFSLLPTYPILSSGSPKKQLIELVWP